MVKEGAFACLPVPRDALGKFADPEKRFDDLIRLDLTEQL